METPAFDDFKLNNYSIYIWSNFSFMNKETILSFLKKYPMTIMLAIIAANLISIGRSLNTEAKLNQIKMDCLKWNNDLKDDDFISRKYRVKNVKASLYNYQYEFCKDAFGEGW